MTTPSKPVKMFGEMLYVFTALSPCIFDCMMFMFHIETLFFTDGDEEDKNKNDTRRKSSDVMRLYSSGNVLQQWNFCS